MENMENMENMDNTNTNTDTDTTTTNTNTDTTTNPANVVRLQGRYSTTVKVRTGLVINKSSLTAVTRELDKNEHDGDNDTVMIQDIVERDAREWHDMVVKITDIDKFMDIVKNNPDVLTVTDTVRSKNVVENEPRTRNRVTDEERLKKYIAETGNVFKAMDLLKQDKIKSARKNYAADPDKLNKKLEQINIDAEHNFGIKLDS